MNGVILCEGFDDVYFLGYLLHKYSPSEPRWTYDAKCRGKISAMYSFRPLGQNETREIYRRGSDKLAIWGVGGKDRFEGALDDIHKINVNYPGERLENIVIVSDRDQNGIDEVLRRFEDRLQVLGWNIRLNNNIKNKITYAVEEENYDICICPIIIPFDESGALETVLMNAISSDAQEDAYVVKEAKQYVSKVHMSGKAPKYLQHARERLKAEFSSVISIMNPDRSTKRFNELLMSLDWEKSEYITSRFKLLLEIFA
ncbi:MAG: hypothetical protein LBQ36_02600 [Synergistaceae bacterium]|jgi:hypothetical protein|nr:hypothetical protein [Synergistaceae bacterium]